MISPVEILNMGNNSSAYKVFNHKTEQYVSQMLNGYIAADYREIKVIHDPVWGTMKFYPWELQILDSPLLQRLRNINQTGLAMLTYPSAHHSRFEHTLGVTALVSKMIDSINDGSVESNSVPVIDREDMYKLRLAAILHDIGHCFFSHLSEKMYGDTEEFSDLKSQFEIFKKAQPHEIMGYVIINTNAFKDFFCTSVSYPFKPTDKTELNEFFDSVGRMIVGAVIDRVEEVGGKKILKNYLTEMINGQFDADSLDYLRRDSYITGLSLTYHIDRFMYKIRLVDKEVAIDGQMVYSRHLTIPISGISTVEEMIFGKQMLTRYIYQHQKVLAADSLVYDIVNGLKENGKLTHPCDYLYYCDDDIYKIYDESGDGDLRVPAYNMPIHKNSSKKISDVVRKIKIRDLPKKALVINISNIKSICDNESVSLVEAYKYLNKVMLSDGFRLEVYNEAKRICQENGAEALGLDMFDIFYSVPKPTTTKNYTDVLVATNDGKLIELCDVVNLNAWAGEFSGRVWNAYVFCTAKWQPVISIAAKNVLNKKGIVFFDDRIFSNLKDYEEIESILG